MEEPFGLVSRSCAVAFTRRCISEREVAVAVARRPPSRFIHQVMYDTGQALEMSPFTGAIPLFINSMYESEKKS
jgi:hypothetical protein